MSKAEEAGEVVAEIVEETIEAIEDTPTEVEAQIAVAKAEATVQRAEEAVAIIEQTAAIQVAQVTIEAEQQIAEHEEKVDELEYDQKWQLEMIKSLQVSMENLQTQMQALTLQQSTPQNSTDSNLVPQTVEIAEPEPSADADAQAEQLENPLPEIAEQVQAKPPRKIRAL